MPVSPVERGRMGDYDPSLEGEEEVDLGGGEATFFPPPRSQSHPGVRPQPPNSLRLGRYLPYLPSLLISVPIVPIW